MSENSKKLVDEFLLEYDNGKSFSTSSIKIGHLINIEGNRRTYSGFMDDLGYNCENDINETPLLLPVITSPHDGTLYVDLINRTLLESKDGFNSWGGPYYKVGVLVEKTEPLMNYIQDDNITFEQLRELDTKINNKSQGPKL